MQEVLAADTGERVTSDMVTTMALPWSTKKGARNFVARDRAIVWRAFWGKEPTWEIAFVFDISVVRVNNIITAELWACKNGCLRNRPFKYCPRHGHTRPPLARGRMPESHPDDR